MRVSLYEILRPSAMGSRVCWWPHELVSEECHQGGKAQQAWSAQFSPSRTSAISPRFAPRRLAHGLFVRHWFFEYNQQGEARYLRVETNPPCDTGLDRCCGCHIDD
jgi:hypothetical protein